MSLERGDVHYWGVWHGNEPFSAYRNAYFRYASEFGFQALPSLKTIETFTLPEDRNLFSYVMEVHQRNSSANGKIMNYLSANYLYPTSFDKLVYASQLLQADGIRYGVEHWRRYRGHCMGAIYWQLNDIWPVTSWASLDYYHRWKALHYYAKRFFAPLLLSCCEEGLTTQNPYVNRESPDMEKSIRLSVANETREDHDVLVKWALRDADASVVSSGEQRVRVPALPSVWLDKTEYPDADIYSQYASYELYENGAWVSSGATLFSVPKHFKFRDPQLSLKVVGDRITVSAKTFAQAVWIFNENDDLVLSDNYFDMNAGERTVSVVKGELKNLRVWSVFDIR
jgi:beta-mannosidase